MPKQNKKLRLYKKHEYLAEYYASKIFNEKNISMEREDVVQELKLKIWTSIQTYLDKWKEYRATGNMKPMPLKFYLKTSLINKRKDFIKDINKSINIPMSNIEFDYGVEDFNIDIDYLNKKIVVDHVDILDGISLEERKFFMLYIKGLPISKINKIYKGNLDPRVCMRINIEQIKQRIPELISDVREFRVFSFDEE